MYTFLILVTLFFIFWIIGGGFIWVKLWDDDVLKTFNTLKISLLCGPLVWIGYGVARIWKLTFPKIVNWLKT